MAGHFFNFVFRAVAAMPARVGSNWGGVLFSIGLFLLTELVLWLFGDMKDRWKRNTLIGLAVVGVGWTLLFPISALLTVYDDHQNLVGAGRRIRSTFNQRIQSQQDQLTATRLECARWEGQNETLQIQNRDQQNTISGCLTQATKLLTPEPLKITPHYLGQVSMQLFPSAKQPYGSFVVLTNRVITPIRLLVTCEADITASGMVLGTGAMTVGGWGGRVTSSSKQYGVGILTPAWTPSNPLLVTVFMNGGIINHCKFEEQ